MKFKMIALSVLAATAMQAKAAEVNYTSPEGSFFNDSLSFIVAADASTKVTGTVDSGTGIFAVTLYEAVAGPDIKEGTFTFTGSSSYTFSGLTAGSYYFTVTGFGLGGETKYTLSTATTLAASVPEPKSYAVALAGLAITALGLSRRRKLSEQKFDALPA